MKNYDYILFDFDGTIMDTGRGITNSVSYAIDKFGDSPLDMKELLKFVGPPLQDSFENICGYDKAKAERAVAVYREYYKAKGMLECSPYEGIEAVLEKLQSAGKKLVIATSKPEAFTKKILDHYKLLQYFNFVAGATFDTTRTKKEQVIAYALESCNIKDKSKVLMVGDRLYDIEGAKINDLDSMGVVYGFGSYEELKNAGATYIGEKVTDIEKIIL